VGGVGLIMLDIPSPSPYIEIEGLFLSLRYLELRPT